MTTQKEIDALSKALTYYGYNLFNGFTHDMYDGATHEDYVKMFNIILIGQDENRHLLKLSKI